MKKIFLLLFTAALVSGAVIAQPPAPPLPWSGDKRPPGKELKHKVRMYHPV